MFILSPLEIERLAKEKQSEAVKIGQYISRGEWDKLTLRQLREQAKKREIPISRTKEDFLRRLKEMSGLDFSGLSGKDLLYVVREYGISRLRDKEELIHLLKENAKREEMPDYASMTVRRLKELALKSGVSLYLTKQEVIEILDRLEPGVNHAVIPMKELIESRIRFNIPAPRTKDELVRALERQFKENLKRRST